MVGEKVELDSQEQQVWSTPPYQRAPPELLLHHSKPTFSAKGHHFLLTQQDHGTEQIKQFSNSLMQIIPSGSYSSQIISSTQKQLLLQLLEKVYLIS